LLVFCALPGSVACLIGFGGKRPLSRVPLAAESNAALLRLAPAAFQS
jgi:hypothetical protein